MTLEKGTSLVVVIHYDLTCTLPMYEFASHMKGKRRALSSVFLILQLQKTGLVFKQLSEPRVQLSHDSEAKYFP